MMQPLRFCMITTFYPPHHFGGDGVVVQRLAHSLVRRGHAVSVICDAGAYAELRKGGAIADPRDGDDGVVVHRLRRRGGALPLLLTHQTGRPGANAAAITRLLDEGQFDVIHYHNISLVGGPAVLGLGAGLKLYTAHEHWLVCPTHVLWRHGRELCTGRECLRCQLHHRRPPQLWRGTGLLERQLANVDAFIAMSEFSRAKHREFGFARDMEVIPGFLPDDAATPAAAAPVHHRPYFLFVGRLDAIKGLEHVIPLFDEYTDADLIILGDGPFETALRAVAAGNPRVIFRGWLEGDDLARHYRQAVAAIVPSNAYETFGLVLIEAFRHGTPVLARRIGALPEIVQTAGGGLLFDSPSELPALMRSVQYGRGRRDALSRAALTSFAANWSEDVVLERYFGLIERIALARGNTRVARALQPMMAS